MAYGISALGRVGIGREQAIGALGSLAGESGRGLNTRAFNPKDPNGGSFGIGQWHSSRRTALENFAKKSKYGLNDFRTQMDFVAHELKEGGTHSHVRKALQSAPTRYKAADIWTKKYEVPAKAYEHLDRRRKNADYFAKVASGLDPGDMPDDESLTGAKLSYAEEGAPRNPKTALRDKNNNADSLFGRVGADLSAGVEAIGGMFGLASSQDVAADAAGQADASGETAAQADSGFFGETSIGAMVGSLAGGMIGGPMGAILGGLAGQGISRALSNIGDDVQERTDQEEENGVAGGVGRSVDGFLGGLFGNDKQAAEDKSPTGGITKALGKDYFPEAPTQSPSSGMGGLTDEGRKARSESKQLDRALKSGTGGLY